MKNEIIQTGNERQKVFQNGHNTSNGESTWESCSDIHMQNYDPMVDIFELFDDPSALNDIDHLLEYSSEYQTQLEGEIGKQRQEYRQILKESGPDETIDDLDKEVLEMLDMFENLKSLVGTTGTTINAMTANIKKLDQSKKNLTFTMTTLKRLQILVTAYDRLEKQLERQKQVKDYLEIRQLLSVVLELNEYFQDFKSIDEINKLNKQISTMKNQLINIIFIDFELEFNEELENKQLIEACHILEALGDAYKTQLETWYINAVLKDITRIFTSSEEAGSLDNLNRRFIYFQNILGTFETKHLKVFPKSWHMLLKVTQKFCSYTKEDLKTVLNKETRLNTSIDENILMTSLSQTLDFEQFLNKKFKYYKDFDEQLANPQVHDFTKSISDVFEPFLNIWIDNQSPAIEKKLQEFTNPSVMFKKTSDSISDNDTGDSAEADESLGVLESAAELFRIYRQILSQLSKLTTGKALIRLSKIFSKYLVQYQHKILDPILPDSKSLVSVNLKSQEEGVEIICLVLNTASYCSSTVSQLEDKIKSLIQPGELSSRIEFDSVNNGFLQLVGYCINLLFYKIENDLQISWKELLNFNWRVLNEVTGESRYMTSLKSIIRENCQFCFQKINNITYIRNLLDKMVDMLLKNVLLNIVKLEPISVVMAEQFKLDLQELKTFIYLLPTFTEGGEKILQSNSFKSNVNVKFKNVDNLMKIMMVPNKPMDTLINSYFSIIGDSNFSNFLKILQLKGIMKNENKEKDKFKYMDMFKLQLGAFEDDAVNRNAQLQESDEFLEKLNVLDTSTTIVRTAHSHKKTNSRSIYLPNTITGVSSSPSGSTGTSKTIIPPEPPAPLSPPPKNANEMPSPKANFGFFNSPKIDTNSLLNTRDNIEKNFAKTFSDNKTSFNENFKKFFKRSE